MGKEQEGISDARGHENEQKKEKNRLRQKNKRGKANPKHAHSNNRQQLLFSSRGLQLKAGAKRSGHRSELWVSYETLLILTTV